MVVGGIASDAGPVIVAGVAVVRAVHASLSDYFGISPRQAGLVAEMVSPEEVSQRTASAVSGREAGGAVAWTSLASIGSEVLEK
jgi:hypothetical protein